MLKVNCLKKNYFPSVFILLLSLGVLTGFSGCDSTDSKEITFFGGKIKNPKGKYIYLSREKKVVDSAKLDDHNKFAFELDSIKEGVYVFNHGPEFQYIYLQPTDSILMYLNTWDFDESLVFSGKGGAKNNFLINLYLRQEKTEKNFKENYKLGEEEFANLIDKGIQKELGLYNEFLESQEKAPTPQFDKLAKTGIYFPYYFMKEYYPYNYMWMHKTKDFPEISDAFYAYRDNLNLNDPELMDYETYFVYVRTYLYHMAHKLKYIDPDDNNVELNFMTMVNEKITVPSLKDRLLATSAWRSMSNEYMTPEQHMAVQDFFFANCQNDEIKSELKLSLEQKEKLKSGQKLPELIVLDSRGNKVKVNHLTQDNNSVIYFWPNDLMQIEIVNEKLEKLQKQFPDVTFIGIERSKEHEEWTSFLETKKLSAENQFKIPKDSECYSWFEGDKARSIIVNKEGNVMNSYLFFTDKYFDMHVADLKKK
jgi:peroxiredoxin